MTPEWRPRPARSRDTRLECPEPQDMDVVSSFRRRPLVISVLRDAIPIHLEVAHRLLDSVR